MESIILHIIYASTAVSMTYLITSTIKHRDKCRQQEAVSLASISSADRVLESHNKDSTG